MQLPQTRYLQWATGSGKMMKTYIFLFAILVFSAGCRTNDLQSVSLTIAQKCYTALGATDLEKGWFGTSESGEPGSTFTIYDIEGFDYFRVLVLRTPNINNEIVLSDGNSIRECYFSRLDGALVEVTDGHSKVYSKWIEALSKNMKIRLSFMKFSFDGNKWQIVEKGEAVI